MAREVCNWMLDKYLMTFNVESEDVSLKTLRGRNPPCPARRKDSPGLVPPLRKDTARESAEAAAKSAVNGYVRALEENDPKMVAARTAQAIAVAASTSHTHAGFVAAATAVESAALLYVEDTRNSAPLGQLKVLTKHAIKAAVDAALAADDEKMSTAPPPLDIRKADASKQGQLPRYSELFPDRPSRTPRPGLPPPLKREPECPFWLGCGMVFGFYFLFGFLGPFVFGEGLALSAQCGAFFAVTCGLMTMLACAGGASREVQSNSEAIHDDRLNWRRLPRRGRRRT